MSKVQQNTLVEGGIGRGDLGFQGRILLFTRTDFQPNPYFLIHLNLRKFKLVAAMGLGGDNCSGLKVGFRGFGGYCLGRL